MSSDPWGTALAPRLLGTTEPLTPRLAELAALTRARPATAQDTFPRPDELAEVRRLAADGFAPLDGAPLHAGLPAVWPDPHRCWVPDRLPGVTFHHQGDGRAWVVPATEQDRLEAAADAHANAAECGLPPPPPGRLWLLRSPWPSLGLGVVLVVLAGRARGHAGMAELTVAAREVLVWTEDEVWARWTGAAADTARAWRARGRTGPDVGELIVAHVGPAELARFPGTMSQAQVLAWVHATGRVGDEAVTRALGWLDLGLPVQPPSDPQGALRVVRPDEAAPWLAAGFGLAEIGRLAALSLEVALSWRAAGFDADAVRGLLRAHPTLTPAEAAAFDALGISPQQRRAWVAAGFCAREAADWTALAVSASQARVWRAVGYDPAAAEPLVAAHGPLPPDAQVGWFSYGPDPADRRYGVVDPPGTRGRDAEEAGR